jgi:hypothetical protein
VGPGRPAEVASPEPPRRVSPLRPDAWIDQPTALPAIAPADPVATYAEPPGTAGFQPDDHEEPALPDEARAAAAGAAAEPTRPIDAGPGQVLHVRFRNAPSDRLFDAMRAFRALIRERPGATPVLVHLEVAGAAGLPIPLKPVAYDSELLAEVRRRLGDGTVELQLA